MCVFVPVITVDLETTGNEISVSLDPEISEIDIPQLAAGEIIDVDHPDYEGPYEITPRVDAQSMETQGKAMRQDVTVLAIPVFEVSNEWGTTINIGG
jgi:hypothetical protein